MTFSSTDVWWSTDVRWDRQNHWQAPLHALSFHLSIRNRNSFHCMKSKSALWETRPGKFYSLNSGVQFFFLPENPYAWLISSPKKSFIVRANSDRERQEWLIHLDRCIHHASGKFEWLVSTVILFNLIQVEVMAVRILSLLIGFPTTMQTHVCIVVHRNSRLTIDDMWELWRSLISDPSQSFQHCRNCGFIVCDGCSKKRFLLPHLDSKPVRVCDACHAKLNNQSPKGE